jgi:hypothetical protein
MALIYCYGDTKMEDAQAKEAAEVLVAAYPNHSWWVEARKGVLIIKHFEASGYRGTVAMVRHISALDHDAKVRKHDIVMKAGELLERAGLKRGARGDDPVTKMELEKDAAKHWHRPLHIPTIH